jgi:hypothetical protein
MTSRETCYHCNIGFEADPDLNKAGDESWFCDECVEKLVKAGVFEDGYHLLEADQSSSEPEPKRSASTLWVIDNTFVSEPFLGGQQLGSLPAYVTKGFSLVHYSQEEFDRMMEEFHAEHGHYPDS